MKNLSQDAPLSDAFRQSSREHGPASLWSRFSQGVVFAGVACSTLVLVSCAAPPAPTAAQVQIATAQAAISHAADMGANEYAPAEIQSARGRLERARNASVAGNSAQALQLSQEAIKDVELAEARLQSAKAERAATELSEGRRVLQTEIERKVP
jgi:hypothetical protein